MGVRAYKDNQGRTRYRVTFSRNGRRLVDERLPAGTSKEKADHYHARVVSTWFDSDRLGIQQTPLISEVIREYSQRIVPGLKSPRFAHDNIAACAPFVIGKTLDMLPQCAEEMKSKIIGSVATRSYRVAFLKTLARYAVKWGMVKQDYGVTIERIKIRNARQHYPQKYVVAQILRHMSRDMREACWQLYYSGMRRGELWAAEIVDECYLVPDSKNGEPRLTPITLPLKKIASIPTMTKDALSKRFKLSAVKAGYGHLRLHDLRHGTASMILNAGYGLDMVGEVLGHRDRRSSNRYAHMLTDTKRTALNYAASGRQVIDKKPMTDEMQPEGSKKKAA